MIRYSNDHSQGLGSERIAKLVVEYMSSVGVDTKTFKAHSLRGAAASTAIASGMDPKVVQHRGGWCSDQVFGEHYSRTHQFVPWGIRLDSGKLSPEYPPTRRSNPSRRRGTTT